MRSRPFILSAVLVLALAGCGEDAQSQQACLDEAYRAAEVTAVVRMYEQGKLGTQEQIESELGGPPGGGPSFFEDDGDFVPFDELDIAHQNQFIAWMSTGRVGELTFDERERARANAEPDC